VVPLKNTGLFRWSIRRYGLFMKVVVL